MKNLSRTVLVISILGLSACSDAGGATQAVEDFGLKDIKITGFVFFGCDEKDNYHTGFEATNPNGQRVYGVVCAGFLKGSTVRILGRL